LKKAEDKDRRAGWISIVPSHPVIRMKEMELEERAYSGDMTPARLSDALCKHISTGIEPLLKFYDYILFDSPPYLSPLARAMLKVASSYVTPTTADSVSIWGTKQFSDWMRANVDTGFEDNSFILVTRFRGTKYALRSERELREIYLKDRTFGPTIPESVNVLTAMERANFDSYQSIRRKYGNITSEVKRLAESYSAFAASRDGLEKPKMIRR